MRVAVFFTMHTTFTLRPGGGGRKLGQRFNCMLSMKRGTCFEIKKEKGDDTNVHSLQKIFLPSLPSQANIVCYGALLQERERVREMQSAADSKKETAKFSFSKRRKEHQAYSTPQEVCCCRVCTVHQNNTVRCRMQNED